MLGYGVLSQSNHHRKNANHIHTTKTKEISRFHTSNMKQKWCLGETEGILLVQVICKSKNFMQKKHRAG